MPESGVTDAQPQTVWLADVVSSKVNRLVGHFGDSRLSTAHLDAQQSAHALTVQAGVRPVEQCSPNVSLA